MFLITKTKEKNYFMIFASFGTIQASLMRYPLLSQKVKAAPVSFKKLRFMTEII